ncbi:MAG TPA: NAD(P)-dependent alcohol dehydrogenase [Candidatus Binataceae bacterium]|nr:NAD(P)-dependent alcohol dehydrogenase [Candidatus Binataceae bacterium]
MKLYEIADPNGIDSLKLVDRPTPKPSPGEVLMRVRATSLNYRDLAIIRGGLRGMMKTPLVPISDGAGDVVETGPGVTRLKKGDRVAAIFTQGWLAGGPFKGMYSSSLGGGIDGMLAEYVVLREDGFVHIPEYLSYEEAATLPCAAVTSWNALVVEGRVKPGDTVLIMGTGGVSIFALQFAKMHGARVIATSSSDAKLHRLKEMGASELINYKTTPDWDEKVLELTGGDGVDHVVEIGGAGTLPKSINAVKAGGIVHLIGILAGAAKVDPLPLLFKQARVQGILVGSHEMFVAMNRAMEVNRVHPVIDKVFPFTEAQAAYRHLESGSHFGKVCIAI